MTSLARSGGGTLTDQFRVGSRLTIDRATGPIVDTFPTTIDPIVAMETPGYPYTLNGADDYNVVANTYATVSPGNSNVTAHVDLGAGDFEWRCRMRTGASSTPRCGMSFRTTNNFNFIGMRARATFPLEVIKLDAGVFTQLATGGATGAVDTIQWYKFSMVGNTFTVYDPIADTGSDVEPNMSAMTVAVSYSLSVAEQAVYPASLTRSGMTAFQNGQRWYVIRAYAL